MKEQSDPREIWESLSPAQRAWMLAFDYCPPFGPRPFPVEPTHWTERRDIVDDLDALELLAGDDRDTWTSDLGRAVAAAGQGVDRGA